MSVRIPFPLSSSNTHLERSHPHIVERLRLLWGYPEGHTYLTRLLVDHRGGRQGFSREVFSEISELLETYPAEFTQPRRAPANDLVWRRPGAGFVDLHDNSRRRAGI
ncbi:MAG TPA: hypothetical protein VGN52_21595 [Burkholderiales bacterium]|jgi:hypothetical protein